MQALTDTQRQRIDPGIGTDSISRGFREGDAAGDANIPGPRPRVCPNHRLTFVTAPRPGLASRDEDVRSVRGVGRSGAT